MRLLKLFIKLFQNIFILNLAVSDVIVCLLSLPFTPVTNIYKNWFFGSAICHLLPMIQAVSVFVSTLSLSAIAIDRYNLVVRPYAHPLRLPGAIVVAVVLWIVSIVASLPYAYYMVVEEYPGYCGQFCTEHWPNQVVRRGYALIVLTLQFLIPFMTMSFCYATIFSRLRERANSKLRKLHERSQLLSQNSRANDEEVVPNTMVDISNGAAGVGWKHKGVMGKSGKGIVSTPSRKAPSPPNRQIQQMQSEDDLQRSSLLAQQRRTTSILVSMVMIFGLTWLPQNVLTLVSGGVETGE